MAVVLGKALEDALATVDLNLVTRAEWSARAREALVEITTPTPRVWVHHTADDRQGGAAVRAHQAYHMDVKGWTDIAYSLLIGDLGEVYEGRGVGVAGGHTLNENSVSHGICLLGNFMGRKPTTASVDSLVTLARLGRDKKWWVPTMGGHRDAPGAFTECPGDHLYALLPSIRNRIREEEDMPTANEVALEVMRELNKRYELNGSVIREQTRQLAKLGTIDAADAVANSIVAKLPAGSVSAAVVKEAVKEALREGTAT